MISRELYIDNVKVFDPSDWTPRQEFTDTMGNLDELNTLEKGNLVKALNELMGSIPSEMTVDQELNDKSENPVGNKAVAQAISGLVSKDKKATQTELGLVKVSGDYGIASDNGTIYIQNASLTEIKDKSNVYKPITPGNLDVAVKEALCNNTSALTPEERAGVYSWLGWLGGDMISNDEYEALENKNGLYFVIPNDIE